MRGSEPLWVIAKNNFRVVTLAAFVEKLVSPLRGVGLWVRNRGFRFAPPPAIDSGCRYAAKFPTGSFFWGRRNIAWLKPWSALLWRPFRA